MAQTSHHAIHMQLPVRPELHFQQDFSFKLQSSCFVAYKPDSACKVISTAVVAGPLSMR